MKLKSKVALICLITIILGGVFGAKSNANTAEPDYRYWNQLNYSGLEYQCYVVAEAKLLYAANIQRSPEFNPLSWFWWKNGYGSYAGGPPSLMENYAASVGKNLTYGGNCGAGDVWEKINAGYYVILHLTNGQSGDVGHYAFVDNEYSRANGAIWIDESGAAYSNKLYGGNGPRALSDCYRNIILNDSVWYYVPTIKSDIPSNVLNLGNNFYSYILMSNDICLFNVDVNSQVVLQKGVWQDTKQAWNFVRQSNGSYKIINQDTKKYLAMPLNADYDGGVITTVKDTSDNRNNYCFEFYLYGSQENCVIKPAVCQTRTVSIDGGVNKVGVKLNMWDYWAVETQIFNIWKLDEAKSSNLTYTKNNKGVTLTWSKGLNADKYNVIIKSGTVGNVKEYKKVKDITQTSYNITLLDGYYEITVEGVNWFSNAFSNTVKFTVENDTKFPDVNKNAWYWEGVNWCSNSNLIKGYSNGKFAPNDKITRGQMVTILYRIEGQPAVSGNSKFSDIKSSAYYADAVKWATDKGIVYGYRGTTKFGPNDNLTRQDLAIMLRNYASYKKKNVNVSSNLSKFSDCKKVSNYANESMQWAVGKGVIIGDLASGSPKLLPQNNATRAEAATMIMRYCKNILEMK